MPRALVGAALFTFLTGCSLIVSVDGLSGGALADEPDSSTGDGGVSFTDDGRAPDAAAITSRYAREVLADRPSLYLRFGESSATPIVKNEVGALDVTYPAGITRGVRGALAGDPDTAITFEGGFLTLPTGQDCGGQSECAIELWMRTEKVQDGFIWIVDHQSWSPRDGWMLQTVGGEVAAERWFEGKGVQSSYNGKRITFGEWHHVVAVFDLEGFRIYYDGEKGAHEVGVLRSISASREPWVVGANACATCGNRNNYQGSLDELAVYEHTLSEARIKAHYAAAK